MKYVIIGASAAGISAAKTLRTLDPDSEIVIISKDTKVYSRCMLHLVLGEERTTEGVSFIDNDFFDTNDIYWIKGVTVTNIDDAKKLVFIDKESAVSYDKLLIATGASASIPPVKNLREAKNVSCLRNIEDSLAIKQNIKNADNVVIIGGGLVGIDAVIGLMKKGVNIHLIEMADRILPLQLDKKASARYEELFAQNNVKITAGAAIKEAILDASGLATHVVLGSGETIPCNFIVVAAGVRSNMEFINGSNIKAERGITIDEYCQTSAKDVFAAGDVTALAPIWPVAVKQGRNAALNMMGFPSKYTDNFAFQNSMNFLGLETVSIGMVEPIDDSYTIDIFECDNVYKKIIHKDGIVYGALIQGDIAYCGVLTYIIKNKVDISKVNKSVLKISFADFYGINEIGEYIYS